MEPLLTDMLNRILLTLLLASVVTAMTGCATRADMDALRAQNDALSRRIDNVAIDNASAARVADDIELLREQTAANRRELARVARMIEDLDARLDDAPVRETFK